LTDDLTEKGCLDHSDCTLLGYKYGCLVYKCVDYSKVIGCDEYKLCPSDEKYECIRTYLPGYSEGVCVAASSLNQCDTETCSCCGQYCCPEKYHDQWKQTPCVTHTQCRSWGTGQYCCPDNQCCNVMPSYDYYYDYDYNYYTQYPVNSEYSSSTTKYKEKDILYHLTPYSTHVDDAVIVSVPMNQTKYIDKKSEISNSNISEIEIHPPERQDSEMSADTDKPKEHFITELFDDNISDVTILEEQGTENESENILTISSEVPEAHVVDLDDKSTTSVEKVDETIPVKENDNDPDGELSEEISVNSVHFDDSQENESIESEEDNDSDENIAPLDVTDDYSDTTVEIVTIDDNQSIKEEDQIYQISSTFYETVINKGDTEIEDKINENVDDENEIFLSEILVPVLMTNTTQEPILAFNEAVESNRSTALDEDMFPENNNEKINENYDLRPNITIDEVDFNSNETKTTPNPIVTTSNEESKTSIEEVTSSAFILYESSGYEDYQESQLENIIYFEDIQDYGNIYIEASAYIPESNNDDDDDIKQGVSPENITKSTIQDDETSAESGMLIREDFLAIEMSSGFSDFIKEDASGSSDDAFEDISGSGSGSSEQDEKDTEHIPNDDELTFYVLSDSIEVTENDTESDDNEITSGIGLFQVNQFISNISNRVVTGDRKELLHDWNSSMKIEMIMKLLFVCLCLSFHKL